MKKSTEAYFIAMITSAQIRGARAMLNLTQSELAKRASISTTGLNNIERGVSDAKTSTLTAIQAALEEAGIVFEPAGMCVDAGPGVRLKK